MAKKRTVTFLGPNKGLSVVGNNYAYAYSGVISLNAESVTGLYFTSGDFIFVGNLNWTWDYHSMGDTADYGITIKFNGSTILFSDQATRASGGRVGHNTLETTEIIIPPNTTVEILGTTESDTNYSMLLTGRVYNV